MEQLLERLAVVQMEAAVQKVAVQMPGALDRGALGGPASDEEDTQASCQAAPQRTTATTRSLRPDAPAAVGIGNEGSTQVQIQIQDLVATRSRGLLQVLNSVSKGRHLAAAAAAPVSEFGSGSNTHPGAVSGPDSELASHSHIHPAVSGPVSGLAAGTDVSQEPPAAFVLTKAQRLLRCGNCGLPLDPASAVPCRGCPMVGGCLSALCLSALCLPVCSGG